MKKNCEKCGSSYSSYKVGVTPSGKPIDKETDGFCCELSHPEAETKGLCQFCNPKSMYYNEKTNNKTNSQS